jgi:alpha-1,2-glucosyltransferase
MPRYLASVAYHKLWMLPRCTASSLRGVNVFAITMVALLCLLCRDKIEATAAGEGITRPGHQSSLYAFHSAVNMVLFPVLFFFSGLYYTDVVSTLFVLICYYNHLWRISQDTPSVLNGFLTIILGVLAIFMRQTNVFWVVVFMGGLEAVHAVRQLKRRELGSRRSHDGTLRQNIIDRADEIPLRLASAGGAWHSSNLSGSYRS